jgi:hypothetical protein
MFTSEFDEAVIQENRLLGAPNQVYSVYASEIARLAMKLSIETPILLGIALSDCCQDPTDSVRFEQERTRMQLVLQEIKTLFESESSLN